MSETEHPLGRRYPELRRFSSRVEADAAFKACQSARVRSPWSWVGLVVCACCVGILAAAILRVLRIWIPISGAIDGAWIGGMTGGLSGLIVQWFWRNRYRTLLRQRLIAAGVPICLKCGYDLRGQIEPRCPECGMPCSAELLRGHG